MHDHILHLTRDYPPRWQGGISASVAATVEAQRREGHDVTVISFDAWKPAPHAVHVRRVPLLSSQREMRVPGYGGLQVFRCERDTPLSLVADVIAARHFDRIEVHHPKLWPLVHTLPFDSRSERSFVVQVDAHGLDTFRGRTEPSTLALKEAAAVAQADLIYTASAWLQREVQHTYPASAAKVVVRPTPLLASDLPVPRPLRARSIHVSIFGRFSAIKNTLIAFEVLQDTLRRNPGYHVTIVGGVPKNVATEQKIWSRFARSLDPDIADRIHFRGWVPRPEALQLMADSQVVVAPSLYETQGLIVQEALGLGCCVVASSIDAHREYITHEENGLLVDADSTASFCLALERLAADPLLADQLGRAARWRSLHGETASILAQRLPS